jgi:cysteine-rich repeat protein
MRCNLGMSSRVWVAPVTVFVLGLCIGRGVQAQSQGPNAPGTILNDASFGTNPWNMPGNAAASDNAYANVSPGGVPTQYLRATNFGFSIPGAAVINGIEVRVEKQAAGTIHDARARIVKGGTIGATDRSDPNAWPATDTVVVYGSNSDLWGETWAPTDINAGGFGFALSVTDNVAAAGVDQITIKVYYSLCGDNIIGLSEDCDDGNTLNGDCCSSTCQFEGGGYPCPDSTVCNGDETCDGAGTCLPGTPLTCDDNNLCTQDSCDPIAGCVFDGSPIGGCRTSAKSVLILKDKTPDDKDKLVWKWIKGQSTDQADFGVPTGTTDYALCIYTGTGPALIANYAIPGNATKWTPLSDKGYKYKDKSGAASGITKIILKGSTSNKSKCLVKGKGAGLDDLDLTQLVDPVLVQLVNNAAGGACFQSTFNAADFIKFNNQALFKAKAK